MDKIFFVDLGVRNMIVSNFSPLDSRGDVGQLWENFLLSERRKKLAYQKELANTFFWRTYSGAELDYVEESNGQLHGFEFKWGAKAGKAPTSWLENYPTATYTCINRDNFLDFI
jgi:predicted AAA+ superfamily ATPase